MLHGFTECPQHLHGHKQYKFSSIVKIYYAKLDSLTNSLHTTRSSGCSNYLSWNQCLQGPLKDIGATGGPVSPTNIMLVLQTLLSNCISTLPSSPREEILIAPLVTLQASLIITIETYEITQRPQPATAIKNTRPMRQTPLLFKYIKKFYDV